MAVLDPLTINQIAAGEVVERPASVIKELIENALDAGASRIEIQIDEAGKSLLQVKDDGCGMSREEVTLALQRHATSKIRGFEDLAVVSSLGFRGEALPSIASVSRLTITTGTDDSGRTRCSVNFGEQESLEIVPGSRGTDVSVEGLFANTPARFKFLKSESSESSAIADVVLKYVLAFPNVAFTLRFGELAAMRSPGDGDLLSAITAVWGKDLARALAEVETEIAGVKAYGFVGPPHINKPTRAHQQLFVNRRPVRSKTLYASIDAAFRSLTPERRYAVAVVHISIDPSEIDVNVSPTKTEIKFHRDGQVFDAVRLAIKSGLMQHGLMPSAAPSFSGVSLHSFQGGGALAVHSPVEPVVDLFNQHAQPLSDSKFPFSDLMLDLKVLAQVMNTFIIASTRRGIVVIDQHVAHERVLYEQLCGLKRGSAVEVQHLLSPETVEFEKSAAMRLCEQLGELEAVGFRLEPFGAQSFLLRAIPAAAANKDYRSLLIEVADELVAGGGRLKPQDAREKIWIMSACRMAVKAGDPLSIPEMERLIADLAETENPYLCPHGRPITVTLTFDELMRKFKRT